MNRVRIRVGRFVTVAAVMAMLPSSQGAAQGQCITFPETRQEVCGDFIDYWQSHGGLAQQGFPLTTVLQELSATDGKAYQVQYFERAVFELHPENQAPHNLLLSLLGTHAYKAKYPNGAPDQQPNSSAGSQLYPETGKILGGRFLEYWRQNGGLAQQGFPISDEFMEKSELDGKTYRVQYFERAVFEHHPENRPPYDVLLTQLGTMKLRDWRGPQVSFKTPDGVTLRGSLFGKGSVAVILSPMCSTTGRYGWLTFGRAVSERGYMALTYDYRGIGDSEIGPFEDRYLNDLRGALAFVRAQGATKIVLAGASCGGIVSALASTLR